MGEALLFSPAYGCGKSGKNMGEAKVAKRLKKLIKANQSLAHIESLDRLLPQLLDFAKEVAAAEASSLLFYNPRRNVLEFAFVDDETISEEATEILKKTIELKIGEGIAGWIAQERKSIIVKDVQTDSRFFNEADKQTGFITRNILGVPVLHGDELLGVIEVLNSKDKLCFDIEDQELLESFADLAAVAIIRSRLIEARLKQQKFQVQLETAAKIQALFWPQVPKMPGGSRVWAVTEPAASVGGDLYDLILLPDNSWLVYVADVSDKGLPAALIMAALWSRIRSEALLTNEVDELLERVNAAMYNLMYEEGFFATIILGKYWPDQGILQLALGGHLPPVWVGAHGLREIENLKGISVGLLPEVSYQKREIILSPGESILFVTDGVTEAENSRDQLFGQSRMEACIQQSSGPPWGPGILEAVNAWRGGGEANDDLTMLEIYRIST
jgi:serine phosphatase RsbU (regulator of sigma subunit)